MDPWQKIFEDLDLKNYPFDKKPFIITAEQIKRSARGFSKTSQFEPRLLCKMDSREKLPFVFKQYQLFLLPVSNGKYVIVKGEGYFDIPTIAGVPKSYTSNLGFKPITTSIGDSEMQHVDLAYATSLIRTFFGDGSLVLTIRGRKYTPEFSFRVSNYEISTKGVQTEVDAGYEGTDKVVLVEVKGGNADNLIIRQLFYPYRQWMINSGKQVIPVLFKQNGAVSSIWQYKFADPLNYNSLELVRSAKFKISFGKLVG